jgi:hypothetical protein
MIPRRLRFPQPNAGETGLRIVVTRVGSLPPDFVSPGYGNPGYENSSFGQPGLGSKNFEKMHVLRRWIEYDSQVEEPAVPQHANWDTIMGVALIVGVSVAFWGGVGLLVVHLLK